MREAIGQTFIVNLILVFIAVLSALLIGSLAYSKAYKVKNRIIFIIEKYGAWDVREHRGPDHLRDSNRDWEGGDNVVQREIEASLKEIGYHLNLGGVPRCRLRGAEGGALVYGTPRGASIFGEHEMSRDRRNIHPNWESIATYDYCVYEYNFVDGGRGRYYAVTTFMHFNVPLIGSYIQFPVHGKTKVLYDVSGSLNN